MEDNVVSCGIQGNNELLYVLGRVHWVFTDTMSKSLKEVPASLGSQVGRLAIDVGLWIELKKADYIGLFA